ncbi:MAG: hypothetical protein GX786_07705, partial [Clostridiales bacterium]|nr:hypothetical protein [Clostridiales bacterium]
MRFQKWLVWMLVVVIGIPFSVIGEKSLSFSNMEDTYAVGETARIAFFSPFAGDALITLENQQNQKVETLVEGYPAKAGYNHIDWKISQENEEMVQGTYFLSLTMAEQKVQTPLEIMTWETSDKNTEISAINTETTALQPPMTQETVQGEEGQVLFPQEPATEKEEVVLTGEKRYFSPSDYSPHDCEHEACFWKLPIGEMNEQAIWEAMMTPITVVKATRDTAADRQIFNVYSEPDEEAKVVGEVTAVSQGIH